MEKPLASKPQTEAEYYAFWGKKFYQDLIDTFTYNDKASKSKDLKKKHTESPPDEAANKNKK